MPYITAGKEKGTNLEIYYKDWDSGQPIVFSHGWPPSADDRGGHGRNPSLELK